MTEIEIRPATPADVDAVADYHNRCFRQTYASSIDAGEVHPPDRDGMREQFRAFFSEGSPFPTQVAVIEGAPIGHVTTHEQHLVHLFVEPDHQGTGLGRRLLELGETAIAADGHAELELKVRVENHRAISFYERAGWTMTDRTAHTFEHGISYDEHVMVKRLSR